MYIYCVYINAHIVYSLKICTCLYIYILIFLHVILYINTCNMYIVYSVCVFLIVKQLYYHTSHVSTVI